MSSCARRQSSLLVSRYATEQEYSGQPPQRERLPAEPGLARREPNRESRRHAKKKGAHWGNVVSPVLKPARELLRPVRHDEVCARALDRGQALDRRRTLIE